MPAEGDLAAVVDIVDAARTDLRQVWLTVHRDLPELLAVLEPIARARETGKGET